MGTAKRSRKRTWSLRAHDNERPGSRKVRVGGKPPRDPLFGQCRRIEALAAPVNEDLARRQEPLGGLPARQRRRERPGDASLKKPLDVLSPPREHGHVRESEIVYRRLQKGGSRPPGLDRGELGPGESDREWDAWD